MLKSISSNWMVIAAAVIVSYIVTPVAIDALGVDGYGVWLIIAQLTAYLYMIRGGLPAASVRYLSEKLARRDYAGANRVIATCLSLYAFLSFVVLVAGSIMLLVFELVYDVPDAWQAEVLVGFVLAVVTVVLGYFVHLPYAVMEAHDQWISKNRIIMFSVLVRLGMMLALLATHASIAVMAGTLFVCAVLELAIGTIVALRRYPLIRFGFFGRDRHLAKKLVRFGAHLLVLDFGAQLAFQTAGLIIGAFMAFAYVSMYSVANSLVLYMVTLMSAIGWVLMPKVTKLHANGQTVELQELFLKWSKVAFSISLLLGLFLAFLGEEFMGWWIDPAFGAAAGPVLQVLVVSFLFYLPVRGVALPVLMGVDKVSRASRVFLLMGVVNIALSLALVHPFGILGPAIATAIPIDIFAFLVLRAAAREAGVSLARYFSYVFFRPLLGALPVAALLGMLKFGLHVEGFQGLFGSGIAMLVVFGVVWVFFVYRRDPYVRPEGRLGLLLSPPTPSLSGRVPR